MQTKTMRLGLALLLHIFFVISVSGNAAPCTSQRFHLTTHAVIDSTGGEATSAGFGNNTCGRGRVPLYPALTVAQARQVCCEKGYAGFNMRIHDGEATGSGCFHFDLYGKAKARSDYDAYVDTDWHPAPPPPPLPPTNRTTPPWQYNMSRFPAGWFGANQSGFENPKQLELMGKFSIVMFGWQHMQLPSNYTNLLELQIEQARQVKEAHPHIPTFVYLPIVDAQPYYESEAALFNLTGAASFDPDRCTGMRCPGQYPPPSNQFRDFLFLDSAGQLNPSQTHMKCVPGHLSPRCTCAQWNFFNQSARERYYAIVDNLASTDPANEAFDGIFFDAATAFLRRYWKGAANAPNNVTDDEVMAIQIELLNTTIALSNARGKYPMFNMHQSDMTFASGREQKIVGAIGGQGMFRFYEGSSTLERSFIELALKERNVQMFTFVGVYAPTGDDAHKKMMGLIAGFLLIRDEYYYFAAHRGYLDNGFKWHSEYDLDYGHPIGEPTANKSSSGVVFTREYSRCTVHVTCLTGAKMCDGWVNMSVAPTSATNCDTDMDCSLNGACTSGKCMCDPPWKGPSCGKLTFAAAPVANRAYGLGKPFSVTSWGGNAVRRDGNWHLYVTEMAGEHCGLHVWGSQSTVTHAISPNASGPYVKVSTVLQHEAHNPQVIEVDGALYIFHIGTANSAKPIKACNNTARMHVPSSLGGSTMHVPPFSHAGGGSTIHRSTDPDGPFLPVVAEGYTGCNNPSPFLHENGTLYLACTWSLHSAPRPEGPWREVITFKGPHSTRTRHWEDPYLFINERGFHIIAHCYSMASYPSNAISGHGFSPDGLVWTWSDVEPYDNVVPMADGTRQYFATMERPKFLYADSKNPTQPTHLLNGVSPVWNSSDPSDPCAACGHCSACKVHKGADWTYTLTQTLG